LYQYQGDANYEAAENRSTNLTVDKAVASIALTDLTHRYDGSAKSAAATTTPSGLAGVGVAYTRDGAVVTPIDAGSYAVLATLTNPIYRLASPAVGTLVIDRAPLAVTASNASRAYGDPNPTFTGMATGSVPADDITAAFSTTADTRSSVGTYPIIATLTDPQGKAANYEITLANGTLTIGTAPLTVTANDKSRIYGAANPPLDGTITGIRNNDEIAPAYATAATAASAVGTYPITATAQGAAAVLANYTITANPAALTVTRAPLSATASNASRLYGDANPAFSGTLTGALPGDGITADFSSPADARSGVGMHAIVPSLADPQAKLTNYDVTLTNGALTIGAAPLTITPNAKSRTYGAANPGLDGTITGIRNNDAISATYATTATVTSQVGSYPITPTAHGTPGALANYAISVTPAALSITRAPLGATATNAVRMYGDANPTFTGTLTGSVPGDGISARFATAADARSSVGTYPIVAELDDPQGKAANYEVVLTNGTLTVGAAPLTITANPKSRTYGAANPMLDGVIAGIRNSDAVTAGYSTSATTTSPVGSYPIAATAQGSAAALANYAITTSGATLTITRASIGVTANNGSRMYGDPNPSFTGTITGVTAGDGITATFTSAANAGSAVGSHPIVAALNDPQGKAANYDVSLVNGTLTIGAAPLTVTPNAKSRLYGSPNPELDGSITGIRNSDAVSAAYATSATTTSPVGSYPITASAQGAASVLANYSITTNTAALAIDPAPLAITPNAKSRAYGSQNPVLDGVIAGLLNGDAVVASYATAATPMSAVGSYPITAAAQGAPAVLGNYSITTNPASLAITRASLSVTADDVTRTYGAANPAFTGTLTGAAAGDGITASFTSAADAGSSVGSHPIVAALADPQGKLANYDVTAVNGTLTINAAPLTITASSKSRMYGAANPALDGAITGIRNSDAISATYATTATEASDVGNYPITPTVQGAPAILANYAISVTPATLAITRAPLSATAASAGRTYGDANPVFTGTLTGSVVGDGITARFVSTADVRSAVGTYPIVAELEDPRGKAANYEVALTNGTLTINAAPLTVTANSKSRLYGAANPALDGVIAGIRNGDAVAAVYSTTATTTSPVGSYPITGHAQGSATVLGNYSITASPGALSITPAPLTVTTDDATRTVGAANPTFTATYSGFVSGDGTSALGGTLSFTTAANPSSPAGEYPVAPGGLTASNYSITFVPGTLRVIGKETPIITWNPADVTNPAAVGPTQLNAVAYATNGTTVLTGTYAYSSNGTPVTTGTILPPGVNVPLTVVFTPSGADANAYNAATMTVTTFNVLAKIDITPGSNSNAISLAGTQKEILVAIVSSANFDARTLVLSAVTPTLGNGVGAETALAKNTNGTPKTGLTDVNADGRLDVLLYFPKATLISNGDVTSTTTQLTVTAQFSDGRRIRGVDRVSVIP
jgi:hypothetical protein